MAGGAFWNLSGQANALAMPPVQARGYIGRPQQLQAPENHMLSEI
jgi:hypothetical protein